MSGGKAGELKKTGSRFHYVPLALEIGLCSIPFLILIVWCVNWMAEEMTDYSNGLDWIYLVRMMEMESCLFEERMADDTVSELDIRTDFEHVTLFGSIKDMPAYDFATVDEYSESDESDNLQISYLFLRNNHELIKLDAKEREQSSVPKDSVFYDQALLALRSETLPKSLSRIYYKSDGRTICRSFRILSPSKPVRWGNMRVSDGKPGSRILISGTIVCDYQGSNSELNRGKFLQHVLAYSLVVLGVMCIAISTILVKPRQVIRIMQGVCLSDIDFTGADEKLKESSVIPQIHDLIENFRLMFLSIQKYHRSISNIHDIYEPALPESLLELFNKEDIRTIQPGDKAYVQGTAVSVRFMSDDHGDGSSFTERNKLTSHVLDRLSSMGAIVTELELDRITGICPGKNGKRTELEGKIRDIRSLNTKGTGVGSLAVTAEEGEFCIMIAGFGEHKRVCMERVSGEDMEI